jgi:putative transposase
MIEVLARLVSERGAPRHLRSDNGPEFVSKALLQWATRQSLGMALIDPGKPWQNGTAESFNGKFRDECL